MSVQGVLANKSGISFEKQLITMCCARYKTSGILYKNKSKNPCQITFENNDKQTLELYPQHKFTDCYDNKSIMDFKIKMNDVSIFIECKYQQSEGSVSSKIPYSCALLNSLYSYEEKNILVYLSGGCVFKTKRIQNIMRHMTLQFPNIKFIHIDTEKDYAILFDYIDDLLIDDIINDIIYDN
jgi:hypothetical protein